jgi:thiol:disulfide interchange protein DsbD
VASVSLSALPSEPFTQARLASYRSQHRAVFVNATAAWCVTCMVNDKVALDDSRVRGAFAAHHVAYLVADWTRRNAEVTALLNAYGRSGVPLYIYYAPDATDAKILPQVLTPDEVLRVVEVR